MNDGKSDAAYRRGYGLVIATLDRPDRLRDTLRSVAGQTVLPEKVVVVDASAGDESERVVVEFLKELPLAYEKAEVASAAGQRNQGSRLIASEWLGFIDDDVVLEADVFDKLCLVWEKDPAAGGVAARMRGFGHKRPRGLLWWYYRMQAGYAHPTYGGKLFGAAVNCLPCYEEDVTQNDVIEGQWLPAGVVLFRRRVFPGFPSFEGYSFMEDVHASARVAREATLYFHASAWYDHYPLESEGKRDKVKLARMRLRNRRLVAREVMGKGFWETEAKMLLLRLFDSAHLLRSRPEQWGRELWGTWTG
jgi:GT2 family glycosyltransferase